MTPIAFLWCVCLAAFPACIALGIAGQPIAAGAIGGVAVVLFALLLAGGDK